jgi:hypothetical protein
MYVVVNYADQKHATQALALSGEFFEGTLLQVKGHQQREEERTDLRTLVVSNIPQTARPEELVHFFGSFGRLVQIELPLLDLEHYRRINSALATAEATQNTQDPAVASGAFSLTQQLENALNLGDSRRKLQLLLSQIPATIQKIAASESGKYNDNDNDNEMMDEKAMSNSSAKEKEKEKEKANAVIDVARQLATMLNVHTGQDKQTGKMANGVLNDVDTLVRTKTVPNGMMERVKTFISQSIIIKNQEIARCVRSFPTKKQLTGEDPFPSVDSKAQVLTQA